MADKIEELRKDTLSNIREYFILKAVFADENVAKAIKRGNLSPEDQDTYNAAIAYITRVESMSIDGLSFERYLEAQQAAFETAHPGYKAPETNWYKF